MKKVVHFEVHFVILYSKTELLSIDPQHLVLPSQHGKMNKDKMMITTYQSVTNSKKHCISRYFIN